MMSGYNETNRTHKIEIAAVAAGAIVALTSLLPMAAQAQTKAKSVSHKATHHITRRHTSRQVAANHPKAIVIHGYSANHPYSRTADSGGSYIRVSTGRVATVSSSEMPAHRWYPEGHSGPGGVIMPDGSLVLNAPDVSIPKVSPVPDYGNASGIVQFPPYSFVGADGFGGFDGFGDLGTAGGYGNVLVPTTPVVPVAVPVAPATPTVPVTTPAAP